MRQGMKISMNRRHLLIGMGGAGALAGAGAWFGATGSASAYDAYAAQLRQVLGAQPDLPELVRYATLAPNSHNTQPWRFHLQDRSITIRPDYLRRTPAVDPDDHHLFISLGAAVETLAIAGTATGRPGEVVVEGDGSAGATFAFSPAKAHPDALLDAITRRQSCRANYDGQPVPAAELAILEGAAALPGVQTILIADQPRLKAIRDLVVAGNGAQMADRAFMHELKDWLRFNPRAAIRHGDGLYAAASGNPILPTPLGKAAFDRFFTAAAENDRYASQVMSSAGVAVFVGERADKASWLNIGRACQRFALAATSLGLSTAFINQPVEVVALRPDLASVIGAPNRRPDLVMRFGRGPRLPWSPRRLVSEVLD